MGNLQNHLSCFLVCLLFQLSYNSQLTSSTSDLNATLNTPFLCHPHQSQALLQFKSAFTIENDSYGWCDDDNGSYPKTESWKEGTDCCSSWDGVTCDAMTGRVIGLDLSCSQLQGIIHYNHSLFSSHIAPYLHSINLAGNDFQSSNLSSKFGYVFGMSLTHLNLSNSHFSGNIPFEISLLSNLVSLDLSGCSFTGNIPSQTSHLSNLEFLDLSSNRGLRFESNPILERIVKNLTRLSVLNIQGVNMSSLHASSLMNLSSSLTSLTLYGCQLQGQFPTSFLLLPNLQRLLLWGNNFNPITSLQDLNSTTLTYSSNLRHLDIRGNSFSTSTSIVFLDFVGNLKSLRYIFLPKNQLNGPIPVSFCNMTQLLGLDLGHNQLTGPVPSCLFALPSLEFLTLNDNKLHGQITTSLFKSVNLVNLDLSSNNFTGSLDSDMLLGLKKLRVLVLSNNNFSSSASGTYNLTYSLPSLSYLDLSSCNLTQFPTFLRALTNLEDLYISNNKIQGSIPKWMFDVGKDTLTAMDLSENFLTSLSRILWQEIRSLDLSSNLLQGSLPIPPPTTQFFSVSKNNLSGEISSLICNLSSLTVLDLSQNQFVGLIPPCLGNLSSLSVLNLGMNNLQGIIPDTFVKDNNLKYLILNENQLRGRLPHSLSYCQYLIVLDVGKNMIEDTFPSWLEIPPSLQVLVLRSNNFFGSINDSMSQTLIHYLRILDVSDNNFAGKLPENWISNLETMMKVDEEGFGYGGMYMEAPNVYSRSNYYSMIITVKGKETVLVKILIALMTIDFSRNKFEGDIPEVMGKLGSLKGLNLSHNLLIGHIPPSLGGLTNLEWLDLSSNKLVGKIPMELVDLTFLAVLNLSYNQLGGPIPQGKQFNTFGNDSYKGNLELCGFPLSKACRTNEETPSTSSEKDSSSSGSLFKWEGVIVGYGCGVVFGVYMGYLVFSSGSPKWFVRMVERKSHGRVAERLKKNGHSRSNRRTNEA